MQEDSFTPDIYEFLLRLDERITEAIIEPAIASVELKQIQVNFLSAADVSVTQL